MAVRVQWDQAQADAQAVQDKAHRGAADGGKMQAPAGAAAVFEVDTRIWKEDAGPIPPRSVDQQVSSTCSHTISIVVKYVDIILFFN